MDFSAFDGPEVRMLKSFLISLGIGILMGVERERNPASRAGLRTFSLVALLGTLCALLAEKTGSPAVMAVGLGCVGLTLVAANWRHPDHSGDPGTTSVAALLLCFGLGATVWYGLTTVAVTLGILATVLLYFKDQLHFFTRALTAKDIISVLQFAVLALVILPVLPNQSFGPYGALNPHQIWWMVVLISGVSLAGYAALRIFGQKHGAALLGLLGGMASSTATTLVFSRHAKENAALAPLATLVILMANLVVLVRLGMLTAVVAPEAMIKVLPVLLGGLLAGGGATLWQWRRNNAMEGLPPLEMRNPTEMRTALGFGAVYAFILFLAAWLSDIAGRQGLFLLAFVSGLTDVDAITLSALQLFQLQRVAAGDVGTVIFLAVFANLLFKYSLIISVAGARLARQTALTLGLIAVGGLMGKLLTLGST